jgi:hypothetical protein
MGDDFESALAAFKDQIGRLAEVDNTQQSGSSISAEVESDQIDDTHQEILQQAEILDQSIQRQLSGAPEVPDDEIDLEALDLEWRFAVPSTKS